MVNDRERQVIMSCVDRGLMDAKVGLFRTLEISAPPETQRLLDRIKSRQKVDELHHAPCCPANHWHRQRLVFQPCNCGAAMQAKQDQQGVRDNGR